MRPMEKSERHHIKENDFQLIMEQGYDWLLRYKMAVIYGVAILVGLVAAGEVGMEAARRSLG